MQARKRRFPHLLLWCGLLSALLHVIALTVIGVLVFRSNVFAERTPQQPEIVTVSSALRIQTRTRPKRASSPVQRPQLQPVHARPLVAAAAPRPAAPNVRVIRRPSRHAAQHATPTLTQSQIDAQTRMFEKTIAQARAASNPVAGAENHDFTPQATRRVTLNLRGAVGGPQAEGVLYPVTRWTRGAYHYYYVRYYVEYADGETESGVVPWPIRFPVASDPLEYGAHRTALPGPPLGWTLPDGISLHPLVKNCYDHRYYYCPIAHEADT